MRHDCIRDIRHDCVFILMKREFAKSFLLTFSLLSIKFFCFNNQVLNVLIQNSSEIREIKTKPAVVLSHYSNFLITSCGQLVKVV